MILAELLDLIPHDPGNCVQGLAVGKVRGKIVVGSSNGSSTPPEVDYLELEVCEYVMIKYLME